MRSLQLILTACALIRVAIAATDLTFEYIVVGSGAGGGPLASRLARAGHSVLLIEAGDDQGNNINYTVPGFQAAVTQDPAIRWDIWVNHYQDQSRAKRDPKFTYRLADGRLHVPVRDGPPPAGATPLGILYPRAGTLGGCVSHNALIWITPQKSDWNYIAKITGDNSWSASNMDKYLDRVYEWLHVEPTDPTILLQDLMLTQHYLGGAAVEGFGPDPLAAVTGLLNTLLNDPNNRLLPNRDSAEGFYQVPLIMRSGVRNGVRERIVDTKNQGYPLTVRMDCHVTKLLFDTKSPSGANPRVTGVEFLDGKHLYRASPLSGGKGTPGTATATKEVIVAGGTYNTFQLLALSGIGPKDQLDKLGIPVVRNIPGLGKNLQDRYEIPVNVKHPNDFPVLAGCTFDAKPHDECYQKWLNNPYILGQRGAYATNGLAAAMVVHSDYASDSNVDLFIFGGPVDFIGYFPGWGDYAIRDHNYFSWYTLKAHTRNTAGTLQLKSTDPLDTPLINFNYFDTGTTAGGADQLDVKAIAQAIKISREALARYYSYGILLGSKFTEVAPGSSVTEEADLEQYIKDNAWGHHACCTAPIGGSQDSDAVLDSKFRVVGVDGLRVVDASVFPKIPGLFIQSSIMMISEKAADAILNG
ncbi:Oxygen-dependent choline dehydrogenase [Teratosphaeria destructans]|uniref:Oxygen-dependent choline dehydrogenase n=1 Tax=Teratosphaeria destructans TaxID=418781 RepID=A0A9W7W3Q3_9PEZI|nr:Oxygen-dependent choline dehydrogenase [Teratosphaeria destructans]